MDSDIDLNLPIVAVFGTTNEEDERAASLLGAAVNRAPAVLLTGGTGCNDRGVKGAAICGAEEDAGEGTPATWIGVANQKHAEAPRQTGPRSVVLTPGWEDRRNFVEACLCDAAIALSGTTCGTASEILFCLYLRRPVVIGGHESVAIHSLRKNAEKRVKVATLDLTVDQGISSAYSWAKEVEESKRAKRDRWAKGKSLLTRARFDTAPRPLDSEDADDVVAKLLARAKHRSPRPQLKHLVTATDWAEYVATCLASGRSWYRSQADDGA